MTSKTQRLEPAVTLSIRPGPTSPKMRRDWVTFWKHLVVLIRSEEKANGKPAT